MANEKSNSPREAAIAVLAKAQKLLNKKSTVVVEDIKTEDLKKSAEFTSGLHTVQYYSLEKHNPQQAALAVLAKAQDLLSETTSIQSEGLQKSAEAESGMHKVEYYKAESLEKADMLHDNVAQRRQGRAAGYKARGDTKSHEIAIQGAKESHKEQLGALKAQPKPNLPKSEVIKAENPDEHQDAKLGEEVEHLCEDHMLANKDAERKEGHKIVSKSECAKCVGGMQKSEFAELYEMLEDMQKAESEEADTENKKAPSNEMKPRIEEKPIERDYQDFETKPGHAPENDHREEPSHPVPDQNPAAHGQGSNPPAGATPGTGKKGVHKLSFFMGHCHSKKNMKKGIALG